MKTIVRLLLDLGFGNEESVYWFIQVEWCRRLIAGLEFSTHWNAQQLIDDLKIVHNVAASMYNKRKFWFERRIEDI